MKKTIQEIQDMLDKETKLKTQLDAALIVQENVIVEISLIKDELILLKQNIKEAITE